MSTEQLRAIHPVMNATNVQILWSGSVGKINTHGEIQNRTLVIASPAIFLLTKRTFPAGFRLSRVIPICRLDNIIYTKEYIELKSETEYFKIVHDDIAQIAAIIVALQVMQMGYASIHASTELKQEIKEQVVDVQSENPTIDRFVSECLALDIPLQVDQINSMCKTLSENGDSIIFTPTVAASTLMPALVSTLCGKTCFKSIILRDVSFMTFLPHLSGILKEATTITSLTFYKTSFIEANLGVPEGFFENDVRSPLNTLIFKHCDLTNVRLRKFFYDLAKLDSKITSIQIINCEFAQPVMEAFFYNIFDANCFRNLNSLVISNVNLPFTIQMFSVMLLNCDWIHKNKCLQELKITNCEVDIGDILSTCFICETGIEELCLSGMIFKLPIPVNSIQSFQQLKTLDISSLKTDEKSLSSFFTALGSIPSQIETIKANNLAIEPADAKLFYTNLSGSVSNLQSLSWDGTYVPNECVPQFITWFCQQKNLIDLSLSDCIPNKPSNTNEIARLFSSLNLERFVLVAEGNFAFGTEAVIMLDAMCQSQTVTSIDLTGHAFGDIGMKSLMKLITRENIPMKGIAFNGSNATTPVLMEALELITQEVKNYAVWPVRDVKKCITKVPLGSREKTIKAFDEIKTKFDKRFPQNNDSNDNHANDLNSQPVARARCYSALPTILRHSTSEMIGTGYKMECVDLESLAIKDTKISGMIKECCGPDSILNKADPIVVLYSSMVDLS
ncbi:hypothetical protein TVAG_039320 [Trichomonas vaginalis G3]|uniref:Leucine Rich Repeat family protein n=1 Tax=Trichomonas vaginalis (strain ATCC PRA-98 / G3) TaxID=412133 RepID=A2E5P3_TRIV3|nr:leucine-rich repeat, isoform f-related family [Trichomonas vaginalis G3]EAY12084.1 hypothetical protein TVAG_039320 [Trichomonas vaginalis G3]KAI5553191.1 leucine-rich repeat, isoform f-related family [Trichomonas vaginalis G3]|eukprot:XP_001324307.1 hypothetical protein [Trichomonas vaginalis G3]